MPESAAEKRLLLEPAHSELSIRRQCDLLGLNRASYYYNPATETPLNLILMRLIDQEYTAHPFTRVNQEHRIYPYLLRGVKITRPNQVWSTDITYLPLANGFMYLTAVIDWYSRYVLAWQLSNTLDTQFCIDALEQALRLGQPAIFNTDQGSQFTSAAFTGILEAAGIQISMDGKGRALDNILIERLWRTVKYEDIYLKHYETVPLLYSGLRDYFAFYNHERPHQSLDYRTPAAVFQAALG